MNTESIDCRKVKFGEMEHRGDFCIDGDTLYVWLPGGVGPDAIKFRCGAPGADRVWEWDGNEDKPTLTPSIHAPGQWHGWMRAGRLVSC